MMYVALHGFHNKDSKYTWRRNVANASIVLDDEKESDLYTISFPSQNSCTVEETVERPSKFPLIC